MNNQIQKYSFKEIFEKKYWDDSLNEFDDANIYQSWEYARVVQNEKDIKHLAFFSGDVLMGLAQVRIKRVPFLGWGIAYIFKGPVWLKKKQEPNVEVLFNILKLLEHEFVIKNKLVVRVHPYLYSDYNYLNNTGIDFTYNLTSPKDPHKTVVLYLDIELEEIRKKLKQKWRNCLNQSERNGLNVVSGTDKVLYDTFLKLYDKMIERKKFKEYVNPRDVGKLIDVFGNNSKLMTFVAFKDQTPVSALVGAGLGNTGIYLLGASNKLGMKNKASYLLQWEMIKWLKRNGITRYDLGGIDSVKNPGVYKFKTGITEFEVEEIGAFDIVNSKLQGLFIGLIKLFRSIKKSVF